VSAPLAAARGVLTHRVMNKNGTTTIAEGTGVIEDRIEGIKESVKGFVDKGGQRVDEIKTRIIEVKDQAADKGSAFLGKAEGFIKANPIKAVGLAFGIGYIGMRLFR
jgi:ElaB/YqjD/DUF883 family membrane-anchored ribosome-binding protein